MRLSIRLRSAIAHTCALACALATNAACTEMFAAGIEVPSDVAPGFALALAGPDLFAVEGERVVLGGAASRSNTGSVRLVWTQIDGPPVALTNPSASTPTFIAPLAPAVLVFRLRAEAGGGDEDVVSVVVGASAAAPGWIMVPPDSTARPGATVSFDVDVLEAPIEPALSVRSNCISASDARIDGRTVTVTLPSELPCAVVVDGVAGGAGLAPAATVFWPEGTPLPAETRLSAPIGVGPGSDVTVSFEGLGAGDVGRGYSADGNPALIEPVESDIVALTVPRRRVRLFIAGEVVRGGASGGVRYAVIDVTAGTGNAAPLARGGPDRIVLPRARFRLDTAGSFDADGDPLLISVRQVLGPQAVPEIEEAQTFIAPQSEGTLLFHVVADDGTVESAPDTVRVIVSGAAENLRPTLPIAPLRYVTPGQTFTIDASGAQDPDSGFIDAFLIAQDEADSIVLLDEPVDVPIASFVAQAAGDTYNFHVSVFDEGGLGTTVDVTIIVEDAGPWVDPTRGDDVTGNGTMAAPFSSVVGALPTAARHALPALLLSEGTHAPAPALLPAGLALVGGHRFDVDSYIADEVAVTTLPVLVPTTFSASRVERLTLDVGDAGGSLTLRDGAQLTDGNVVAQDGLRTSPLIVVPDGADARIERTIVDAGNTSGAPAVSVAAGAVLATEGATLRGGIGADATALSCANATVVLVDGTVTGSTGTVARSVAVEALSCVVVVAGARLEGGTGDVAVGLSATSSLISADAASVLVGRTVTGGEGIGASLADDASPITLEGTIASAALDDADAALETNLGSALVLFGARADLSGARVRANAPGARGIVVVGGALSDAEADISVRGAGAAALRIEGNAHAEILGGIVTADAEDGVGVTVIGPDAELFVRGVTLRTASAGIRAPDANVSLFQTDIEVSGLGASDAPLGLSANEAVVDASRFLVAGVDAVGVETVGATVIRSSSIRLDGAGVACAAVRAAGGLDVLSSFIEAAEGGCTGIDAGAGRLALVHATVRAATGIEAAASITVHNSALSGTPGVLSASDAPFDSAIAVAFGDVPPLVITASGSLNDLTALVGAGCDLCLSVNLDDLIDETGHLRDGENALVDAADPAVSLASDIDGDARPRGVRADIGCDER